MQPPIPLHAVRATASEPKPHKPSGQEVGIGCSGLSARPAMSTAVCPPPRQAQPALHQTTDQPRPHPASWIEDTQLENFHEISMKKHGSHITPAWHALIACLLSSRPVGQAELVLSLYTCCFAGAAVA
eukprot:361840-Chlamydomonas_euryale.AAC.8